MASVTQSNGAMDRSFPTGKIERHDARSGGPQIDAECSGCRKPNAGGSSKGDWNECSLLHLSLSHLESFEQVATHHQEELSAQQTQDPRPRCPTCAAFPHLTHAILEPRTGKTVRLYRCRCGERIWDD